MLIATDDLDSASGQMIESGYGGEGKLVVPHSYAARVTYKIGRRLIKMVD